MAVCVRQFALGGLRLAVCAWRLAFGSLQAVCGLWFAGGLLAVLWADCWRFCGRIADEFAGGLRFEDGFAGGLWMDVCGRFALGMRADCG